MFSQRILILLITEVFFHPYELALFLSQMETSWQKEKYPGRETMPQKSIIHYLEEIYLTKSFLSLYHGFQYKLAKIFFTEYIIVGIWNLCSETGQLENNEEIFIKDVGFLLLSVLTSQPIHSMMLFSFAEYLEPDMRNLLDFKNIYHLNSLYQGMSSRFVAEFVLLLTATCFNRLMKLPKTYSTSLTQTTLMVVRDFIARRMSCPLQVLANRMTVFKRGWHWVPAWFPLCFI